MKYLFFAIWVAVSVYSVIVLSEGNEEAKLVMSSYAKAHADIADLKKEIITGTKGKQTELFTLYYKFDANGSTYKGDIPISEELYKKAQGEKKLQGIIYYTKDPKINGLKNVYEQASSPIFTYGLSGVISVVLAIILLIVFKLFFNKTIKPEA